MGKISYKQNLIGNLWQMVQRLVSNCGLLLGRHRADISLCYSPTASPWFDYQPNPQLWYQSLHIHFVWLHEKNSKGTIFFFLRKECEELKWIKNSKASLHTHGVFPFLLYILVFITRVSHITAGHPMLFNALSQIHFPLAHKVKCNLIGSCWDCTDLQLLWTY